MECPMCHSNQLRILDTRTVRTISKERRRECIDCWCQFWTEETIIADSAKMPEVKKKGEVKR